LGAILGVIFGILLPSIFKRIYFKLKKDENNSLMGRWFSYNLTYKEEGIRMAEYEWIFKRNLVNGHYIARGKSKIDPQIQYSGKIDISKDYLYLWGKGKLHDENVTFIFRRRYPYNQEELIYGAFLGLDYDKVPFSGLAILSRSTPGAEESEELSLYNIIKYHLSKTPKIEYLKFRK
jgi:hypothetical protein